MVSSTKNMTVQAGNAKASVSATVQDSMPGVPCPGPAGYVYKGLRYVPVFADPIEWNSANTYEALTIVMNEGNSYTSKQAVPVGIEITNEVYWAKTFDFNAQLENVNQGVISLEENINKVKQDYLRSFTNLSEMKAYTPLFDGQALYCSETEILYTVENTSSDNSVPLEGGKYATPNIGVFTPEMFGAKGDGVADDSTAFNLAIQAGNVIANGNYRIASPLVMPQKQAQERTPKSIVINGKIEYIGTDYAIKVINTNNIHIIAKEITAVSGKGILFNCTSSAYQCYMNAIEFTQMTVNNNAVNFIAGSSGVFLNEVIGDFIICSQPIAEGNLGVVFDGRGSFANQNYVNIPAQRGFSPVVTCIGTGGEANNNFIDRMSFEMSIVPGTTERYDGIGVELTDGELYLIYPRKDEYLPNNKFLRLHGNATPIVYTDIWFDELTFYDTNYNPASKGKIYCASTKTISNGTVITCNNFVHDPFIKKFVPILPTAYSQYITGPTEVMTGSTGSIQAPVTTFILNAANAPVTLGQIAYNRSSVSKFYVRTTSLATTSTPFIINGATAFTIPAATTGNEFYLCLLGSTNLIVKIGEVV